MSVYVNISLCFFWSELVCGCHVVLVGHVVVFGEEVGVFSQRGTDLLLLLKPAGVGDLDMAALGGRLVHNLLQPGIELAVRGVRTWDILVVRVAGKLGRDLIQDFSLRLFLAQEGQFPPGWVGHDNEQELKAETCGGSEGTDQNKTCHKVVNADV